MNPEGVVCIIWIQADRITLATVCGVACCFADQRLDMPQSPLSYKGSQPDLPGSPTCVELTVVLPAAQKL